MAAKITIGVRISEELVKKIEKYAEDKNCTSSDVARMAIEAFFSAEQRMQKQHQQLMHEMAKTRAFVMQLGILQAGEEKANHMMELAQTVAKAYSPEVS